MVSQNILDKCNSVFLTRVNGVFTLSISSHFHGKLWAEDIYVITEYVAKV
jgi:hypothetical protein